MAKKRNWLQERHFRHALIARDLPEAAKLMRMRDAAESEEGFLQFDKVDLFGGERFDIVYEAQVLLWGRITNSLKSISAEIKAETNQRMKRELRRAETGLLRMKAEVEVEAGNIKEFYESTLITNWEERGNR